MVAVGRSIMKPHGSAASWRTDSAQIDAPPTSTGEDGVIGSHCSSEIRVAPKVPFDAMTGVSGPRTLGSVRM